MLAVQGKKVHLLLQTQHPVKVLIQASAAGGGSEIVLLGSFRSSCN